MKFAKIKDDKAMQRLLTGFNLLEGPRWVQNRGLLFSDVKAGGVYCLGNDGKVEVIAPHRKGIGGLVPHEDGGIVVSGRNVAHKSAADGATDVFLERPQDRKIVAFNDLTTDRMGRIYVGALGYNPNETELAGIGGAAQSAPLFRIDLDGSVTQVWDSVFLSNGLGFTPDGSCLYLSDSADRTVYAFDVDADGALTARRALHQSAEGLPDGLAVDIEGAVWVAMVHAGTVIHILPDGEIAQTIEMPLPMVTSVSFGGEDMRDLYIVTGSDGTGTDTAGSVYRTRVDIPGTPVAPARVKLSKESIK